MIDPLLLLLLAVSYLIGGIPFAAIIGRWRGVDVLRSGSGNAGALNTLRTAGWTAGVIVALLDLGKAVLAMVLARWALGSQAAALCGAAAVAGHCFSPYLIWLRRHEHGGGWKMTLRRIGGKGLATGVGALVLIDWRLGLLALVIFGLALLLLRSDVTWPTIIAVALTAPVAALLTRSIVITVAVALVSALVIIKHLPDVRQGFWIDQTTT